MDLNGDYLAKILGAHSISRTVLNHYYEEFSDEIQEDEMLIHFQQLCEHFKLSDKGYQLLSSIFESLKEFRKDRNKEISIDQFNLISQNSKDYVNWVVTNFNCFEQSENGEFNYYPVQ
jgi:hypothetical protein